MYSYGPPHMAKQKQDDQLEHTYSSYVRIRDVDLKTCQKRWMPSGGVGKYGYVSLTIQLNIIYLFTHSSMIKLFYLKKFNLA